MTKEIKTLSDLMPDQKNFNKGTTDGGKLLEDSLSKFGCGRSILVDKDGNIIAGNKTAEKCQLLGIDKVLVVETTGDELVVVKRTDIDLNTDKGREMALADNVTSLKDLDLDLEMIEEVLGDEALERWGLQLDEDIDEIEMQEKEIKPADYCCTLIVYEPNAHEQVESAINELYENKEVVKILKTITNERQ